jgi:hypothetical protein
MSYTGTRTNHDCGCKTILATDKQKNILTKACWRFPGCFVGKLLEPKIYAELMAKQQRQVPAG